MDLKDSIQIFSSGGKGVTKSMVYADWNQDYNMKHHSTLHQHIDDIWTEMSKNSINLFNASKFRLHRVEEDLTNDLPKLKFLLGTTSYKEFIGTSYSPFAKQLVDDGTKHHSDSLAYMSNPVGVGGMLETKDKQLVFMRRSNICAEMPGLLDRPGGHPEPSAIIPESEPSIKVVQSSEVVDEIYDSVLKEIRDEINIPLQFLTYPLLLGISYNPATFKRPSLEFFVRCSLTAEEVKNLYSEQTHAEKDESTDLFFVPVSDVLHVEKLEQSQFYSELTHAAQSAIYLLQIYLS